MYSRQFVIPALCLALGISVNTARGQEPSPKIVTIHNSKNLQTGAFPQGGLVIGTGGVLYGTTQQGGTLTAPCPVKPNPDDGCGTVYQLTPPSAEGEPWTETVLHRFANKTRLDGHWPFAGLTLGADGVLYGTTEYGGEQSGGTIFQLTPPVSPGEPWTYSVIVNLTSGNGFTPECVLAIDANGNLYGTAPDGGDYYPSTNGTVFETTPPASPGLPWLTTTLYNFTGENGDGANPQAGVVMAPDGSLFGTTPNGGSASYGTVFELTPPASQGAPWTETVIYSFGSQEPDGLYPMGGLTIGAGGVLYGTTSYGGTADFGTVFQVTPPAIPGAPWTESVIYNFTGQNGDSYPISSLVLGSRGMLYGATTGGEAFELTPPAIPGGTWTQGFSLAFTGSNLGGLALATNGVLYGTGSAGVNGEVFKVVP